MSRSFYLLCVYNVYDKVIKKIRLGKFLEFLDYNILILKNRRDIMKQLIVKLLIFFYISFSFVSATHIHHDAEEHFDTCKICVIVKAYSDVDTPFDSIVLEYNFTSYLLKSFTSISINILNLKGFYSHAPPFLLL